MVQQGPKDAADTCSVQCICSSLATGLCLPACLHGPKAWATLEHYVPYVLLEAAPQSLCYGLAWPWSHDSTSLPIIVVSWLVGRKMGLMRSLKQPRRYV
jgi:hypothetical protein